MDKTDKVVYSLGYKCMICRRSYASEEGVLKHLSAVHLMPPQTSDSNHYTTFVRKRHGNVKSKDEGNESSINSVKGLPEVPEFSFKCSKCFQKFNSYYSVKEHLQTLHNVTKGCLSDFFSYEFIPKTVSKDVQKQGFTYPFLRNKLSQKGDHPSNPSQKSDHSSISSQKSDHSSISSQKSDHSSNHSQNTDRSSNHSQKSDHSSNHSSSEDPPYDSKLMKVSSNKQVKSTDKKM